MFSETLDVYSGKDERFKRFQDAAIKFIGSLADVASAAPLYKFFPTKPYREYLQKLNAVQDVGKCHVQTINNWQWRSYTRAHRGPGPGEFLSTLVNHVRSTYLNHNSIALYEIVV